MAILSAFSISLIKVFGYRTKEIRKLYLDGNFFIIAIGAAICLPLAKLIMNAVYPSLVSNVNCGTKLAYAPWLWAVLYGGILVLYFIINRVLVGRLNKIVPAESWSIDLSTPERILTVTSDLSDGEIVRTVEQAGYKAEVL